MKRTRKWAYVEQEAKRLAGLGLTPLDIATRLGVNKATINRWIAAGKLTRRRVAQPIQAGQSPEQWAATVRKDYSLDATDEQLVTLAQRALELGLDPVEAPPIRINAWRAYASLVKQLNLVARLADQETPTEKPSRAVQAPVHRSVDPRKLLMAVK